MKQRRIRLSRNDYILASGLYYHGRRPNALLPVEKQRMLGYVDEAVEMTLEEMEFISQRLKGHTFSHERISTERREESWWAGAQRLSQQREQRLQELTQQLGE